MNTGTARAKVSPTESQLKVLVAVHTHIHEVGVAPSLEELGCSLKVVKSAVYQTLKRLRRDGFVHINPKARYRNISLSADGLKAVRAYNRESGTPPGKKPVQASRDSLVSAPAEAAHE